MRSCMADDPCRAMAATWRWCMARTIPLEPQWAEMAATERDACARVAPAPPASLGTSVARSPLLRNSSTASFGKRARESTSSAQRAATSRPILSLSASMSMGVFSPCLSTTR